MKTARSIFAILICSLLVLSACNLNQATPTVISKGGGGGGGGDCGSPAGSVLTSPGMWAIIDDLTPNLDWDYASPGCTPDSYSVHLRTGPLFADDLGSSSTNSVWTPASDLQPGTEYAWGVQAVDNSITGPYAGESYFFTGPMCPASSQKAVTLVSPPNNWVVHDLEDLSFIWDYPDDCLIKSYWVGLTTNLDFSGSPLTGATANPTTRWRPGVPLTDCTRYYWMVRPIIASDLGPYSQVYTFKVEISGGCPPESNGMIRGTVWDDQCVNPGGGIPDPLPLGCVLNNGSLLSNATYDPGEPGIPGLVVSLNQGACPSNTTLRDVPTGSDGTYDFFMVSPGTYCVSVDTAYATNGQNLLPGNWTYPPEAVNTLLATRTVTVAAGQDAANMDFGWWYQMGTPWGDTSASVFGQVWSDLCVYHQGDPAPDPLPQGCVNDSFGIHGDKVKQPGEPGIAGVVVDIGPGDCPSAGLATATTDVNGYYNFNGLAAGKYCLRIDPDHGSSNESVLLPGQWTVIPSGHEGMSFRPITLVANQTLPGQDFGWDYDDTILSVQPPFLTLDVNAYCRKGPGPQFESNAVGVAGQSYHIEAISEDDNFVRVRFDDALRCWMGRATGKITGTLLQVPKILTPPQLPSPLTTAPSSPPSVFASPMAVPAANGPPVPSAPPPAPAPVPKITLFIPGVLIA